MFTIPTLGLGVSVNLCPYLLGAYISMKKSVTSSQENSKMLSLRLVFLFAVCSAKVTSQHVEGASGLCPDHWIDATLSGLGCLFFNTTSATMEAASVYCQHPDNNASLVEIWSELQFDLIRSELMFLQDIGVHNDWWIGATDQGTPCIFGQKNE